MTEPVTYSDSPALDVEFASRITIGACREHRNVQIMLRQDDGEIFAAGALSPDVASDLGVRLIAAAAEARGAAN